MLDICHKCACGDQEQSSVNRPLSISFGFSRIFFFNKLGADYQCCYNWGGKYTTPQKYTTLSCTDSLFCCSRIEMQQSQGKFCTIKHFYLIQLLPSRWCTVTVWDVKCFVMNFCSIIKKTNLWSDPVKSCFFPTIYRNSWG